MSTLTPAAIRQRIAAAIAASLAASNWRPSRYHYDLFPGKDSRQIEHKSYAVGVSRTVDEDVPQKLNAAGLARGILGRTYGGVRFAYRIRADAQVTDGDLALAGEAALVVAIMGVDRDPALLIRREGVPVRRIISGTVHFGEIGFSVLHRYPTTS